MSPGDYEHRYQCRTINCKNPVSASGRQCAECATTKTPRFGQ